MARNIFSRMVWKLTNERWLPLDYAKRLAYKTQVKNWNIQLGTYQLTDQWKEYSNLFSEKRAIIRKNRARQNQLAKKRNVLNWVLE
jgi:IS1 family transposase